MADNESVERIISQIREDGDQEIDSILEKARSTAAGIVEKAESSAGETAEKILSDARERADLARRRLLSSVSIEVKRAKLKAREEIITRITDRVRSELARARKEPGYAEILTSLTAEAVEALDGDTFQVYVDGRDVALLRDKVFPAVEKRLEEVGRPGAKLEALPLEKESLGGARVGVPGGRVIFDNTFEARIYRLRDRSRNMIFEEVFDNEGSEGSGSA